MVKALKPVPSPKIQYYDPLPFPFNFYTTYVTELLTALFDLRAQLSNLKNSDQVKKIKLMLIFIFT